MLRTFVDLRDLHTNYVLPTPYQGPFAFLGILLEQFWERAEPRWLVSKVFENLTGDDNLVAGAEVTHWNGSPMALALARVAALEAGSNPAARTARGLENMTLRTLALSPAPDEDWVDLRYKVGRATHETRLPWRVFDSADELGVGGGGGTGRLLPVAAPPARHLLALDLRTEVVRHVKKALFAPDAVKEERRVVQAAGNVPTRTRDQAAAGVIPTSRPDEIKARTVETSHGTFGHIRLYTFSMKDLPDVEDDLVAFLEEFARLLGVLPREGLILDVRGNGGGYVIAAEFLLQFLTPRSIEPEPMQFISTRTSAGLCRGVDDLGGWLESIEASTETGAQYSSALPLYPPEVVNSVGQLYHGPIVLITDALCYSATDIFAAGFADHEIGPVLGVDENTGAGGANVWTHEDLVAEWPDGPFEALPAGVQFRVSLRRCLRVGKRSGQPVEDLGVVPDERHRLTRRDLMESNVDLMERAGSLLAARTPRRLDAVAGNRSAGGVPLEITTTAVDSVDIYVNGRPVHTAGTASGGASATVRAPSRGDVTIRIEGFADGTLVAARTLTL